MATQSHKKQHAVPVSYLSAWIDASTPAGQEPYVHVFSKDGHSSRRKPPSKIFTETDLYTIRLPDGGRDLTLEKGLSQLESAFVRVRRDALFRGRQMTPANFRLLALFVAAMHSRTTKARDHHQEFWRRVNSIADDMRARLQDMSGEERQRLARMQLPSNGPSIGQDEVRELATNTMPKILPGLIRAEMQYLPKMWFRLLRTVGEKAFITSDAPVLWFDPDAYKRPPMYRGPSVACERLEITLPISPRHLLLVTHPEGFPEHFDTSRVGLVDYIDVNDEVVDMQNCLVRANCREEFIADRHAIDPLWFRRGRMPDDAWERLNPTTGDEAA